MKILMYSFPVLFLTFAVFFGYISFSVLFKKKPVIIQSNRLFILIALAYIPSIIISLVGFGLGSGSKIVHILYPLVF